MKKIFKIHVFAYIMAFIAVLTAHFHLYLVFMLLIFIHELGHIITAYLFKWQLKQIIVLPLGMISKYDNLINTSLSEELTVASMGVILQLIFYLIFFKGNKDYDFCNLIIIVFNLLPIIPLDGSKILNVLLNKVLNYKVSYFISLIVSFIAVIILLVIGLINKDIIILIVFTPLLMGLIKEYNRRDMVINKFYLERYLYHFHFPKTKYINGIRINKMKKGYYHYFKDKNKIYDEDKIMQKVFDKQ